MSFEALRNLQQPMVDRDIAMLRAVFDIVSSPVFVHQDGRLVDANGAALQLTGRTRDQLLEIPFWDLIPQSMRSTHQAAYRARVDGRDARRQHELEMIDATGLVRLLRCRFEMMRINQQMTEIVIADDISDHRSAQKDAAAARTMVDQLIENNPAASFAIDRDHVVTHWNRACTRITGVDAREVVGRQRPWQPFYSEPCSLMLDLIVDGEMENNVDEMYDSKFRRSDEVAGAYEVTEHFPRFGGGKWLTFTGVPLHGQDGSIVGAIATLQDVTEQRHIADALCKAYDDLDAKVQERTAQLEQVQMQLLQSDKMASVGQLAAGVAHEINNPIGYVFSNMGTLDKYLVDLFALLAGIEGVLVQYEDCSSIRREIASIRRKYELDFLKEDIPALMGEAREGITRVKKIVQDLKDFSHLDRTPEFVLADLHTGLESTLNVVSNEIKYRASVVKEFGVLPEVECLPSQMNQVFLNLLVNAAHAMGEQRGTITIRTGVEGDRVYVEIADDGAGIPPEIQKRIFDPFFTTKGVGKGTGLGLSMSYGIVQKHDGAIEVNSKLGEGSQFRVWLPIAHNSAAEQKS